MLSRHSPKPAPLMPPKMNLHRSVLPSAERSKALPVLLASTDMALNDVVPAMPKPEEPPCAATRCPYSSCWQFGRQEFHFRRSRLHGRSP
jgi:hypothetical protein